MCRRRNGRWNEDETNFLIRMVRELGKGKWKRILEQGGALFQNRSQVIGHWQRPVSKSVETAGGAHAIDCPHRLI